MPPVARRTRQSRDRRRAELRDRLLVAAEQLASQGEDLAGVPVERLAAIAGFSRSTFYGYFVGRGDLLLAWFQEITTQMEAAARPFWALEEAPSRGELRELVAGVVHAHRPHAPVMATIADAASYEPELQAAVAAVVDRNVATLKRHLARGQREGWIAGNVTADVAPWLVWMVERGQNNLPPAAVDQAIEGLTDVMYLTLYAYA